MMMGKQARSDRLTFQVMLQGIARQNQKNVGTNMVKVISSDITRLDGSEGCIVTVCKKVPVIVRSSLSRHKSTPSPSSVNFSWRKSFQKENMLSSLVST